MAVCGEHCAYVRAYKASGWEEGKRPRLLLITVQALHTSAWFVQSTKLFYVKQGSANFTTCATACSVWAALRRWQGPQPVSCWTSPSGVPLAVRPQLGLEVERHLQARMLAGLPAGRHLHLKALAAGACRRQASACVVPMGGCDCSQQTCMSDGSTMYIAGAAARHFAGPLRYPAELLPSGKTILQPSQQRHFELSAGDMFERVQLGRVVK